MKKLTLLTAITLAVIITTAQWEWQNPSPQGNALNDVFFINQNIGWAVGELGTIIKTEDGGESFEMVESYVQVDINAIEFFSIYYGFAVGNHGTILESNNGGDSWNTITSGTTANINDMCLVNSNAIWIAGEKGILFSSDNGGNSWESHCNDTTVIINSIYFLDDNNGWAVGRNDNFESVILHTDDGGSNWTETSNGTQPTFTAIHFNNLSNGWATADDGDVYKTEDGGTTWILQFPDPEEPPGPDFDDIYFSDANNGWTVGYHPGYVPNKPSVILHTSNGGETWEDQQCGAWWGLNSVHFIDTLHGCAVGNRGNIVRTENSGNVWDITCGKIVHSDLYDVFFSDPNHGWAVGGSGYPINSIILRTSNGGNDWEKTDAPYHIFRSVFFINSQTGWVAGSPTYVTNTNIVQKTNDGGLSWETQYTKPGADYFGIFKDIWFTDQDHGWIVGGSEHVHPPQEPILLYTEDGGENWEDYSDLTDKSLSAVCFINEDEGWIAGHEHILHTTDGGQTWEELWTGIHSWVDLCFVDTDHGWILGDSCDGTSTDVVMRTIDGGESWETQFFNHGSYIKKISFGDINHGWIIGDNTRVHTNDGGVTWEEQFINASAALYGIFFLDQNLGWVVGSHESILHTESGGTVSFEEHEVKSPKPEIHCYPNPFTTSTTIAYKLQQPSTVQITIYNHLGKQLEVIEQNQSAGKQQVVWNAEGLPSGVYFCVLKTERGTQTLKMIKMK